MPTTIQEQEAIRRYDHPRRLVSNQIIISALSIILLPIIFAFTRYGLIQMATIYIFLLDGIFITCLVLYAVSFFAARRHHFFLATRITIISTDITIITASSLWIFVLSRHIGADGAFNPVTFAQFTSLSIPIVLAGVLGEPWMIIITIGLMNLTALIYVFVIPIESMRGLFIVLVLGQQWVFSAIVIAISWLTQRTLADLGQALVRTEQLDILKDQFITNVNHELRTPLMTLQLYLLDATQSIGPLSPEEVNQAAHHALRVTKSLVQMVQSILNVRQIDQEVGDLTVQYVKLRKNIEEAIASTYECQKRPITIEIPDSLHVWADPTALQQIMTNLLSNACKYSEPDSPITLLASAMQEGEHSWVHIQVKDQGLGIPPDQKQLLFNRFVRLPRDLASTITGNGLGLYLCRIFTEGMGGHIHVESEGIAGKGSTFHIYLPSG
jgi:signal transduction histidine kinase